MRIQRGRDGLHIWSPAKVNLFLEVGARRADGYHEVRTVMCPLTLGDRLTFQPTDDSRVHFDLQIPSSRPLDSRGDDDPAWQIPSDEHNLAVRAVEAVRSALRVTSGCHIRLKKAVPAAAGLGGGSGNAAAAVVAGLLAWHRWDRKLATEICAELGSDVPFFLGAENGFGLTAATGRGEICQSINVQPELHFVLTHPPVGCSTRDVYAQFSAKNLRSDFPEFISACKTGQFQKIGARLSNALQLPASRLTEWIDKQIAFLADCGFENVIMSGSGSACFAVSDRPLDVGAWEHLQRSARAIGLERVFSTRAWYGESIEQQEQEQGS